MIENLFGAPSGGGTDELAKVSSNDTTAGYLNGKLVAGSNVTLTENNNGGNETLTIAATVPVTSVNTKTGAVTLTNTDVGAAATSHTHAAADITSGVIATARLGTGTADATTYLAGDQTYKAAVTSVNGSTGAVTVATGLTGFTGSQNTASPNNTVNASQALVNAASTNADAVIQPKGTGAFQLQLADGAITGGSKRGANAIDLQTTRSSTGQVASGVQSVTIGSNNTASGARSLAAGFASTASGTEAVAIGVSASSSGQASVAGPYSTAVGQESVAVNRGTTGTNALRSFAMGQGATTQQFQFAHGCSPFSAQGDAQYERYVLQRVTTTNVATEMATDGNPATATRMVIPNDTAWVFHAFVVGRNTAIDNDSAGYEIKGVIDNNANTVAFVGTPTVTALAEDTPVWDVTVAADNTNKALVINVQGVSGVSIRWVATVHITKVTG